ncbi:hypothetical protein OH76DRAFT_213364 [Lentinus brumalis]|uniref:Uncharacterized protein n=1 Tax=Lentinus brumalis TaxID=2498619 RepID=A0A371CMR0_9APHY|nr:hypothetical protein OH76DRAFT_213364 [Polyporus brumalis]
MGSVCSIILLVPVALLGCVVYVVLAVVGTACDIVSIVLGAIIDVLCMPFICCCLCFEDDYEDKNLRSRKTRDNLSSDTMGITGKGRDEPASPVPPYSSSILTRTCSRNRLSGISESTDQTLHEKSYCDGPFKDCEGLSGPSGSLLVVRGGSAK